MILSSCGFTSEFSIQFPKQQEEGESTWEFWTLNQLSFEIVLYS